ATAGAAPAYDKSKAEGEARLRAVIAEGLDATILNPVGVLGPFDHRPSILGRSLVAIGRSGPIIGAEGGFSWVDVRDVCAAIITAIDRGAPGENHLLSAGYCSSVGLCELAGRAAGRTGRAWRMPLWFLRLLLPLQPLIRLFSSSADGFSADAIYALRTRLRVDPSKAEQVLGFQARPIAESVADAMAWWRENGYLD
ncbi:MAG: hypothetical protein KC620_14095, partial [Myxococcales bacterium]|nr:hypothetical protein [Myxococcales bacterium]